ncbi:MAG TPA: hypothetical protein VM050_03750 [Patescibacteria group bacterium]|nr:hypothetical protein [Patescibacteria group bacterium]
MAKTSTIVLGLAVIAIGLGVPVACLYATINYGFNGWTAAFISVAGIIIGGGMGIVGVVMGPLGDSGDDSFRVERERLKALRVQQRTNLEEFDEVVTLLGEIRDALKAVEE